MSTAHPHGVPASAQLRARPSARSRMRRRGASTCPERSAASKSSSALTSPSSGCRQRVSTSTECSGPCADRRSAGRRRRRRPPRCASRRSRRHVSRLGGRGGEVGCEQPRPAARGLGARTSRCRRCAAGPAPVAPCSGPSAMPSEPPSRSRAPADGDGLVEHLEQPAGELAAPSGPSPGSSSDGELVAAQTRDERVGPAARSAAAQNAQQLVARRVPERVVDRLEAVEVEHHHRTGRGAGPAARRPRRAAPGSSAGWATRCSSSWRASKPSRWISRPLRSATAPWFATVSSSRTSLGAKRAAPVRSPTSR